MTSSLDCNKIRVQLVAKWTKIQRWMFVTVNTGKKKSHVFSWTFLFINEFNACFISLKLMSGYAVNVWWVHDGHGDLYFIGNSKQRMESSIHWFLPQSAVGSRQWERDEKKATKVFASACTFVYKYIRDQWRSLVLRKVQWGLGTRVDRKSYIGWILVDVLHACVFYY